MFARQTRRTTGSVSCGGLNPHEKGYLAGVVERFATVRRLRSDFSLNNYRFNRPNQL
jgi:hypothetical protein